ncbi:MAG: hypothetical protein AVO33_02080 [delta proteobacterium ML8_F1]|nr:MAG: hypothetical protein AVO33_02080 [delta proteobacterium ML8_F1]
MLDILQFFTRFPIKDNPHYSPERFARALWLVPLLGGLIGGLQMIGFTLLKESVPVKINILLMLVLEQGITGGLHLDGLADTADGLFSGRRGEAARAIMKTGGSGPLGVFTLLVAVLVQLEGIAALAGGGIWLILGVLSRWSILVLGWQARGKPEGLGGMITGRISHGSLLVGTGLSAFVLCVFVSPLRALAVLGGLVVFIAGYRLVSKRILGGLSGDQYGFVVEMSKALVLLGLLVRF